MAFDELQKQKASSFRDDTDDSLVGSEFPSVDGFTGDLKDATDNVVSNEDNTDDCMGNAGSKLERCTQRCGEGSGQDEKTPGYSNDGSSPFSQNVIKSKPSNGAGLRKDSSTSSLKDMSCLKGATSDSKDVRKVDDRKQDDNGQKAYTNGNKFKKLVTKRSDGADGGSKCGVSDAVSPLKIEKYERSAFLARSGESSRGGNRGKHTFGIKADSPDSFKSGSDINGGRKDKILQKVKTGLKMKNEVKVMVDPVEADGGSSNKPRKFQLVAKRNVGTNETVHTAKKLRHLDSKDGLTLGSLPEKPNSASPTVIEDNEFKKSELRRSMSRLKMEKGLSSSVQIGNVGSDDTIHRVQPVAKHRNQVQQVMSDSSSPASNGKTDRSSVRMESDGNNAAENPFKRKRRAVCLYDDDDEPKTPVHGGAAKNIKSPLFLRETKGNNGHSASSDVAQLANRNSSGLEYSQLKELSSHVENELLSSKQVKEERAEVALVQITRSPEHSDLKQYPTKVAKRVNSSSPLKSPHSVPSLKPNVEPNKSSKPVFLVSTQKKADLGSSKTLNRTNSSQNQLTAHKKKPLSSMEVSKTPPLRAGEIPVVEENLKELDGFHDDRYLCF